MSAILADDQVENCVLAYGRMSAAKDALKVKIERIEEDMAAMKEVLMAHMDAQSARGITTKAGASLSVRNTSRFTSADYAAFGQWVLANPDAVNLYEKRLHQGNTEQWMKEHPDNVPPGLQVQHNISLVVKLPKKPVTQE